MTIDVHQGGVLPAAFPAARPATIPGPRGWPLLGVLPQFRRNPLRCFLDLGQQYGEIVRLPLGPMSAVILNHPAHVKHVLQDNHRNYRKSRLIDVVRPLLGEGLLTSDGEVWAKQRRTLQPAFAAQKMGALTGIMIDVIARHLDRWGHPAQTVDMAVEMPALALNVLLGTLFSTEVGEEAVKIGDAINRLQAISSGRVFQAGALGRVLEKLPTRTNREFKESIAFLDGIVARLIAERQDASHPPQDLLTMLLTARDPESGEGMSPRQLRDEVMTMFAAGHETTANALAWTFYLLGRHPRHLALMRAEVDRVIGARRPTLADLGHLPLTRRIIQESLRLKPAIWWFARTAIADDQVAGYAIPAGTTVIISQYLIHRLPEYWPDPERFEPDRFLPENTADRSKFAYFPFGAGPRACIGGHFAMAEMQLVLAMVAQRFDIDLDLPDEELAADPYITLRPHGPVPVSLRRRPSPLPVAAE